MRRVLIIVLGLSSAVLLAIDGRAQQRHDSAGSASASGSSAHVLLKPDQLKWEDAAALPPGAKLAVLEGDPTKEGFFTMRAKFPAGYKIPPHTHPSPERVTVLSGTFHLGKGEKFDESAGMTLPAGSYTSMPSGMQHFAWAEGETIVQISTIGPWGITYVNPADDPRKDKK